MAGGDYSQVVTTTSTDEVGLLARAFTTMSRDLAATDQQRRELISTVSHELRTPLAAQRAVLENLVDGVIPPSATTLSAALTQAERLSDLVDDLLDLSRLESGTTRLDVCEIDVAVLLEAAVREARLAGREVRFEVAVEDGMRVRGDRARLAQVLANLLDNAARHSPPDGVVSVTAGPDPSSSGTRWHLDVLDRGPGIAPDVADRLFERYSTGGEHGGGTGLGLAIARWICDLHGGRIVLVRADSGAHVRVTLPVDPSEGVDPHPPTPRPSEQTMTRTSPNPPAGASATPSQPRAPLAGATAPAPAVPGSAVAGLWPERESRPQPAFLLGSLGVGAAAALLAFERRLGLAAFVVLLLGGALVWLASAYRRSRLTVVSGVLAIALGLATIWRAAEWLTVVSVLLGGVVAAMALTRATKVSGILAAVLSWPLSGLRGLPLLGRTITATSRLGLLWPVLRTAALSLVAIVLFGGLFASADAIFGSWAGSIVPDLRWDSIIARTFIFVMVAGITLAGSYLALNPPRVDAVLPPATRSVRRWEWAVPVGLVVALFAGFHIAQASATVRGHDYVRETTGMSYADYVHQGFAQLTIATMLMLAVVAITLRKAAKESASDRLWLRVMLGSLSVLTLAVVVSALWRMHLYQQAFGFTTLRLFVDGFELWLGLIVLMVLVSLVRLSTRWVGRSAVLAAAVLMVGLSVLNPDAWVARHNIERFESSGRLDAAYLATLSDDAVPTIAESALPDDLTACIIHVDPYASPVSVVEVEADDWLELNLGRERAAEARASVPLPMPPQSCGRYFEGDVRDGAG
jgi:two-component system, OmpR family, sensor histidine kinase BaeS